MTLNEAYQTVAKGENGDSRALNGMGALMRKEDALQTHFLLVWPDDASGRCGAFVAKVSLAKVAAMTRTVSLWHD